MLDMMGTELMQQIYSNNNLLILVDASLFLPFLLLFSSKKKWRVYLHEATNPCAQYHEIHFKESGKMRKWWQIEN